MSARTVPETELAALVIAWLREDGWTIYQEVEHFNSPRIADIVAWKDGLAWVVEVKSTCGFELLEQALHYRGSAHRISMAAPLPATDRLASFVPRHCVELGIGFFHLDAARGTATPLEFPRTDRKVQSIGFHLRPEHMRAAPAGTQTGGRSSQRSRMLEAVVHFVQGNHGCTVPEVCAAVPELGRGSHSMRLLMDLAKRDQIPGVRRKKLAGGWRLYPESSLLVAGKR